VQKDIDEQNTTPLPCPVIKNTFHGYLHQHRLTWLQVARAADVPCLTVWSIDHGLAVTPVHATRVRHGLFQLTGLPYTGPIATFPSPEHTTQEGERNG